MKLSYKTYFLIEPKIFKTRIPKNNDNGQSYDHLTILCTQKVSGFVFVLAITWENGGITFMNENHRLWVYDSRRHRGKGGPF